MRKSPNIEISELDLDQIFSDDHEIAGNRIPKILQIRTVKTADSNKHAAEKNRLLLILERAGEVTLIVSLLIFKSVDPHVKINPEGVYFDWILRKYPEAARYIWEGSGGYIKPIDNEAQKRYLKVFGYTIPHFSEPEFREYIKGFILRRLGLRKKVNKPQDKHTFVLASKENMNPVDYWYATNPELKSFMDNYWIENKDLVKDSQLKEDMRYLYEDCVAVYDKMQVLTVLSAIKMYL